MKWKWSYLINPLGAAIDLINDANGVSPEATEYKRQHQGSLDGYISGWDKIKSYVGDVHDRVQGLWDDYTGKTAIDMENQANMELAKYQNQMQEEMYNKYSSPQALMRQYQEGGLNPNLIYGSASSGQGNVPSFSLPKVSRNMSTFEKFQVGMQLVQGLLNIQNLKYNVDASREIAEQSGIKTLNYFEDLLGKRNKNKLNSAISGFNSLLDIKPRYRLSLLGRQPSVFSYQVDPNQYSRSMRNYQLNRAMDLQLKLGTEYGRAYDFFDNDFKFGGDDYIPNYWWRNQVLRFDSKQRQFNYDWDEDYKTLFKSAGFAGPLLKLMSSFFR